jgi:hypothetical protein
MNRALYGLKTPSYWHLTWEDYFALGKQASFILGPVNDSTKNLTLAEF